MGKDGLEGWITIKGNAGTVYVEEAPSKVYTIKKKMALQAQKDSGSSTVRELELDEVVEMMGNQQVEKLDGMTRIKCKALSDGKTGWVLQRKGGGFNPWTPNYRCVRETQIYQKPTATEDLIVRKLDKGEAMEFLAGPEFDGESGAWAKFRMDRDKAVGYVNIQDAKGVRFLSSGGK